MRVCALTFAVTASLLAGCAEQPSPADDAKKDAAPSVTQQTAPDEAQELCLDAGPQTPRDIADKAGLNPVRFDLAPPASEMNLCNIHTHTNAEHKGPGFSVFVGDDVHGGYACNDTETLTETELASVPRGDAAFKGVEPGDTVEVHWVYTSCDAEPGEGLGSCVPEACSNPLLRVESQVFLVVNDPDALNFMDYAYAGTAHDGLHQPKSIPSRTGDPVVFRGSTTGPSYTQSECSPYQVTWSVRPECARLDIGSLDAWAASGNVFNETKSHGVRQLVTAVELLAAIE